MLNSHITSRRDVVLMGCGLALLGAGRFADSHINQFAGADSATLQEATERLSRIPTEIGTWISEAGTLTPEEIQAAGIHGYVRREYKDQVTGYRINLTLLCGLSGPMSVHPPTACFEGVGYTLCAGPAVVTMTSQDGTQKAEFNKSSFQQGDTSFPEVVRVFWGWGSNGTWQAPQTPRIEFSGQPFLYKLYVTDRAMAEPGSTTLPQIETFLQLALPEISGALSEG